MRQFEGQRLDFQCIQLGLGAQLFCFGLQRKNRRLDTFSLAGIEV